MSRSFLTAINLNKNEIQNAVAQVLGSAPGSPVPGQFYYDSVSGRFVYRGASAWIDPTARANHSGTQLAATISDFDANVTNKRLDQFAAPTGPVSLNSQKLTNVADGTGAQDAATFGQLQAVLQGRDFKDSVRVAVGTNVTIASPGAALDGITLANGETVLLYGQTTGSQNGLYTFNGASSAMTRRADADTSAKVTPNLTVMVEEGTQADKQMTLTTNAPITLGTTALTFAVTGSGTTYTQGTGISITSNVIAIDTAVVTRKVGATIGDGSATSINVTHNLNSLDVQVQLVLIATGETIEADVTRTGVNQVTIGFAVAPASNTIRVLVQG